MEDSRDGNSEIERLKAIGAWMREVGATELQCADGLRIRLSPQAPAPPGHGRKVDPDEQAELSAEERALSKMSAAEKDHYRFWRKVTRSSGAPIPPFVAKGPTQ